MKLLTRNARLGRFILGRLVVTQQQAGIEIIGPHEGFDTHDDAEAQLSQIRARSINDTVLILQVTGEFRAHTTLVPVEAI
mgnify:CR=1 FL=1